jgi:hypothetical protein
VNGHENCPNLYCFNYDRPGFYKERQQRERQQSCTYAPFISSEQEIFAMASNRFHDTITKRDDALRSKKSASPAGVIEHVCSASGLIAVAWD